MNNNHGLHKTEFPARRRCPFIAADAGRAVEDFRRVVFPLDGLKFGEVLAVVILQVVWIVDGSLKPNKRGGEID